MLFRSVPLPVIRTALRSFTTSFEQNPGRLNVYDGHPFRVLLDYAHNPAGLTLLSELVPHLRPHQGRVIGVMGVAGDRRIVGLAHLHRQSGGEAEFAVAVADGWQQRGVGTALMSHLIAVARSEGIIRVSGVVLADNRQMLELCGHLGFIATQDTRDGTELKVSLAL